MEKVKFIFKNCGNSLLDALNIVTTWFLTFIMVLMVYNGEATSWSWYILIFGYVMLSLRYAKDIVLLFKSIINKK